MRRGRSQGLVRSGRRAPNPSRRALLGPGVVAALAVGVLVLDHFQRLNAVAVLAAAAALAAVLVGMARTYLDSLRLLAVSRREALHDGLTGLGNRRRLQRDLEQALAEPFARRALVLL